MSDPIDPASRRAGTSEAKRTKRSKGASPTQRALTYCRKLGWTAEVVERWNPHARIRKDLFGFVDIVAIDDSGFVRWLQVTSTDHMTNRIAKIEGDEKMRMVAGCISVGGYVEVWGWAKRGAKGKRKLWTLRRAIRGAGKWYDYADGDVRIWPTESAAVRMADDDYDEPPPNKD